MLVLKCSLSTPPLKLKFQLMCATRVLSFYTIFLFCFLHLCYLLFVYHLYAYCMFFVLLFALLLFDGNRMELISISAGKKSHQPSCGVIKRNVNLKSWMLRSPAILIWITVNRGVTGHLLVLFSISMECFVTKLWTHRVPFPSWVDVWSPLCPGASPGWPLCCRGRYESSRSHPPHPLTARDTQRTIGWIKFWWHSDHHYQH